MPVLFFTHRKISLSFLIIVWELLSHEYICTTIGIIMNKYFLLLWALIVAFAFYACSSSTQGQQETEQDEELQEQLKATDEDILNSIEDEEKEEEQQETGKNENIIDVEVKTLPNGQ
jgi:hypothetical protein